MEVSKEKKPSVFFKELNVQRGKDDLRGKEKKVLSTVNPYGTDTYHISLKFPSNQISMTFKSLF